MDFVTFFYQIVTIQDYFLISTRSFLESNFFPCSSRIRMPTHCPGHFSLGGLGDKHFLTKLFESASNGLSSLILYPDDDQQIGGQIPPPPMQYLTSNITV